MISDKLLCDYLFGLLEQDECVQVERLLDESSDVRLRYKQLKMTFNGLDELEDEFVNPVKNFKKTLVSFCLKNIVCLEYRPKYTKYDILKKRDIVRKMN